MGIKRPQSYYEQIYKEYETSGKSVKDFCKSINLPLSTFYHHCECKMEKANNHLIDITEILSVYFGDCRPPISAIVGQPSRQL